MTLPPAAGNARGGDASRSHAVRDDGQAAVTVYGAAWCSACNALEATLRERGVPFDLVDVDRESARYDLARKASGSNAIPLTSVVRWPSLSWYVGNEPDAIEHAYKGS